MTQTATIDPAAPASTTPPAADEPSTNFAVQRCCAAYGRALFSGGGPKVSAARDAAQEAYKRTLPHLTSRASIRDFIACITHGMVLGVFWNDEGPRLVTAAKAALGAVPREPASCEQNQANSGGRPPKNQPTPLP